MLTAEGETGGSMQRQGIWGVSFWLLGIGASACGGAPPADPQRVTVEEKRLLRPYLEGAPAQIGCEELTVTMTANFASRVSQPAIDKTVHVANKKENDDWHETEWINLGSDPKSAFVVTISDEDLAAELATGKRSERRGVTFTVLRAVRFRVLKGKRALALDADTKGSVFTVENGRARDLSEFKIADGVLHAR
jgi:hypothetical protein